MKGVGSRGSGNVDTGFARPWNTRNRSGSDRDTVGTGKDRHQENGVRRANDRLEETRLAGIWATDGWRIDGYNRAIAAVGHAVGGGGGLAGSGRRGRGVVVEVVQGRRRRGCVSGNLHVAAG